MDTTILMKYIDPMTSEVNELIDAVKCFNDVNLVNGQRYVINPEHLGELFGDFEKIRRHYPDVTFSQIKSIRNATTNLILEYFDVIFYGVCYQHAFDPHEKSLLSHRPQDDGGVNPSHQMIFDYVMSSVPRVQTAILYACYIIGHLPVVRLRRYFEYYISKVFLNYELESPLSKYPEGMLFYYSMLVTTILDVVTIHGTPAPSDQLGTVTERDLMISKMEFIRTSSKLSNAYSVGDAVAFEKAAAIAVLKLLMKIQSNGSNDNRWLELIKLASNN